MMGGNKIVLFVVLSIAVSKTIHRTIIYLLLLIICSGRRLLEVSGLFEINY